jgi:hypothetical protein
VLYNDVMRRFLASFLRVLVAPLVVTAGQVAHAAPATLCNDDFTAGAQAAFQGGFAAGEGAAVKLEPPSDGYPFTVTAIQLLFGDDGTTAGDGFNVTMKIFDDTGTSVLGTEGYPGAEMSAFTAGLLSSTDGVNQAILDTPLVVTSGAVWVAVFCDRDGPPCIASESAGGFDADRNAIFSGGGWESSEFYGVSGDWIIRAVVDTPTATPNAACDFEGDPIGEGEGEGEGGGEGDVGEGEGEGEGEPGALVITNVNPNEGVEGADVVVTLLGDGFTDATTFRIGSSSGKDVEVQSATAALVTVPGDLAPGTYDVIAQDGGDTFVFPSGFTVTPAAPSGGSCRQATSSTWIGGAALLAWAFARGSRRRTARTS